MGAESERKGRYHFPPFRNENVERILSSHIIGRAGELAVPKKTFDVAHVDATEPFPLPSQG